MGRPEFAAVVCWLLGAASVAHAEQPLPTYPGAVHTRIGSTLFIAGEPHRLAYFTTGDSVEKVAQYFRATWRKEGYPVTVDGDFRTEGVVSAFFTREGLQRSVVLRTHQGKTVGLSVLKDLWNREHPSAKAPLLELEGTLYANDLRARDDAGWTQRSSLVAGKIGVAKAAANQRLTEQGWSLVQVPPSTGGAQPVVVTYARGQERLMLSFSQVTPTLTAVSQVLSRGTPGAAP